MIASQRSLDISWNLALFAGHMRLDQSGLFVANSQACESLKHEANDLVWQDPIFKVADSELEGEAKPLALWQPSCIYAVRLLSLCLGECNPRVLAAWTSLAAEIKAAVGTVMNMPEVQQPGD